MLFLPSRWSTNEQSWPWAHSPSMRNVLKWWTSRYPSWKQESVSWSPGAMAPSPLLLSLVCEFYSNDCFSGKKKDAAFILVWVITSVVKKLAV